MFTDGEVYHEDLIFQSSFRGFLLKAVVVAHADLDPLRNRFQSSFRGFLLKVEWHPIDFTTEFTIFQSSFRGFLVKGEKEVSKVRKGVHSPFNPLLEDFS